MDAVPTEVLIASIVAIVGFLLAWRFNKRVQAELDERVAQAHPAEAEILEVRSAPMQDRSLTHVSVIVSLRVFPGQGEPYESIGAWEMETARHGELRAGQRVPVRVAHDDSLTIFPAIDGATYDMGNHHYWLAQQAGQPGRDVTES